MTTHQAPARCGHLRHSETAACTRGIAPSFGWRRDRAEIGSVLVRRQPDGTVVRRYAADRAVLPLVGRSSWRLPTTAEIVVAFSIEQLLALFCCQPVSYTYPQAPNSLNAPYACCKIRAEQTAIGGFIRQPAYRCQSQVDRRGSIRMLFECDSVSRDYSPVEGKPRLRAIPLDELSDGMLIRTF